MSDFNQAVSFIPHTVEEAVDILIDKMQLKDKTKIAKMKEDDVIILHLTLGNYIRNKFGLWSGNEALMESCKEMIGKNKVHGGEASSVIIRMLWRKLCDTHALRLVK